MRHEQGLLGSLSVELAHRLGLGGEGLGGEGRGGEGLGGGGRGAGGGAEQ